MTKKANKKQDDSKANGKRKNPSRANNPNQMLVSLFLNNNKTHYTDEEIQEKVIKAFGASQTLGLRRLSNVSRIRNRINNGRIKVDLPDEEPIRRWWIDPKTKKRVDEKPEAAGEVKPRKAAIKKKAKEMKAEEEPAKKKPAKKKPAKKVVEEEPKKKPAKKGKASKKKAK